jgi:hypothetical protein
MAERSGLPLHGTGRVGSVRAVGAGVDGTVEMRPQRGMVLMDSSGRLPDRPGDAGASTLGCGCASPIATTEADCTCQLTAEEVAFNVACAARSSSPVASASAMSSSISPRRRRYASFRWGIEERAGGRAPGTTLPVGGPSHGCGLAAFGGDEVEHVVLAPGVGEEPGEVPPAFEVAHPHRVPVERDGPVVALRRKTSRRGARVLMSGSLGAWRVLFTAEHYNRAHAPLAVLSAGTGYVSARPVPPTSRTSASSAAIARCGSCARATSLPPFRSSPEPPGPSTWRSVNATEGRSCGAVTANASTGAPPTGGSAQLAGAPASAPCTRTCFGPRSSWPP